MANYKKFLVCADNHGGLVCPNAAATLMDFSKQWKPHYRVHLGDVWDFAPLRHGASQEDKACGIKEDYELGWTFMEEFKPTHLTLGNHDDRIWMNIEKCSDGLLRERCAELAGEAEDRLRKMRTAFVPYCVDSFLQMPEGGPKLLHGFRSTMYPAKAHFDHWGSCLVGHVHHPDSYVARNVDGGKAYALGCIGDIQKMTYANRYPSRLGWRNSFLYGLINTRTGAWHAWEVTKENGDWVSPNGIL